ncbi:conserved hypothetical protein [delta proteobacterium NaphS2]|nr:conserved hypothetical protein [delta proteobacterium NaphS2]
MAMPDQIDSIGSFHSIRIIGSHLSHVNEITCDPSRNEADSCKASRYPSNPNFKIRVYSDKGIVYIAGGQGIKPFNNHHKCRDHAS